MKYPILFIHGFAGGRYEYQPIISFLKKHGNSVCYEFVYEKKFGIASLKKIADELHEFVISNVKEPEIDIVAMSQGGVIARWYIGKYRDKKIRRCITLCSPHHGSLLAYIGIFPGIKDLQPGSPFLKELDSDGAEYYTVYNPLDLMVVPGWSGKMEKAKENKCVYALAHPLTFWNKKTCEFILRVLST